MPIAVLVQQQLLRRAYERYDTACLNGGEHALVEARYELALALVADGWRPPPVVVAQIELDRARLEAHRVIELTDGD